MACRTQTAESHKASFDDVKAWNVCTSSCVDSLTVYGKSDSKRFRSIHLETMWCMRTIEQQAWSIQSVYMPHRVDVPLIGIFTRRGIFFYDFLNDMISNNKIISVFIAIIFNVVVGFRYPRVRFTILYILKVV